MSQLGIGGHVTKAQTAKFYVDVDPPPKHLRVPEKKSKFLKKSPSSSFLSKKESKYSDIFSFFKPQHNNQVPVEVEYNKRRSSLTEMLSFTLGASPMSSSVETADFDFATTTSGRRRGALILGDDFDSDSDGSSSEEEVDMPQLAELSKEEMTAEFAAFIYGVGYLSWTTEGE